LARILWLSDLPMGMGGAASTDERIVKEGLRRGYDMSVILPQHGSIPAEADLLIVSNAAGFPESQLSRACGRTPYVVFLHDYWPLCKWRLYYSAMPKCRRCKNKALALRLLSQSKLIFWLSPLHRQYWLKSCPELEERPHALIPPCVDPEPFEKCRSSTVKLSSDDKSALGVNCLLDFKGRENVVKYAREHPEINFTFVGGSDIPPELLPPNCRYVGPKPSSEMPKLYATHTCFIHLPSTPQPGERTVLEAYFSGAKLILNELVGILSYNLDWSDRPSVKRFVLEAPRRFWQEVERECF